MLHGEELRGLLTVSTVLLIGVLFVSSACVIPASAQQGTFQGRYDMILYVQYIGLEATIDIYRYTANDTLTTYFGSYSPYSVTYRPDYRLQSNSSGYIDVSSQHSYSSMSGNLVRSETTYTIRLTGYKQVTYTTKYDYGNYTTLTDNATLFEETYTERYYENGTFVESTDYHEYTYLWMHAGSPHLENVTVDAGKFECIVLDNFVFKGANTDIDNSEDWAYFQGGYSAWIDTTAGHLVKQLQYDKDEIVVGELFLMSLVPPAQLAFGGNTVTVLIAVGGGAGAAAIVAAVLLKSRHRSVITNPVPSIQ